MRRRALDRRNRRTAGGKVWQHRSRGADARSDGFRRHDSRARLAPVSAAPRPYTLVAELTYRCPLRCLYCSNPVDFHRSRAELSSDDWRRVFSEAAELGVMQLHLSGGEPVLRDDLFELIEHARARDLYTNLITGGTLLDEDKLRRL